MRAITFAEKIILGRHALGESIGEAAYQIQIDGRVYARFESGEATPKGSLRVRIQNALLMPHDDWWMVHFGERLAHAREGQHMTRVGLAESMGLNVRVIEAWEWNRSVPHESIFMACLSEILHVRSEWLELGIGQPVVEAA